MSGDSQVRTSSILADARKLPPSMARLGQGNVPFGLYPWRWVGDGKESFDALRGGLFCPPILRRRGLCCSLLLLCRERPVLRGEGS